jgi:uncharacterized repeat protein (TIGR03806 family)
LLTFGVSVRPEPVEGLRARALAVLVLACLLTACQRAPRTGLDFEDGEFPSKLSEWRILARKGDRLTLNERVTPYDLNSALFSDYAHKLRTIVLPVGAAATYGEADFDFPVGTVITKTFYYPRAPEAQGGGIPVLKVLEQQQGETLDLADVRLLETRLLINTRDGWVALPYVWRADQKDATLELAGAAFPLELVSGPEHTPFTYLVPDANQCAGCHAVDHREQTLKPIGPKARHLNKNYRYADRAENQLTHWRRAGLLKGGPPPEAAPRNARWDDPASGDVVQRARAYLDVNCGHCHSPSGPANTSGLLLHAGESDPAKLGVCKLPVASGRGSGDGLYFDIVPGRPDISIFLHRMASTEPDVAMPELGRSLIHAEGVGLMLDWISSLRGECGPASSASL